MNRKIVSLSVLVFLFSAIFAAQDLTSVYGELEPALPGWCVEGNGTHFEITDSPYLDVTLTSSEIVHVSLESVPKVVDCSIESLSSANSTMLTLSGFLPVATYYRYQDGNLAESFTTDSAGAYSYSQDISDSHHIFIVEEAASVYIYPNGEFWPEDAPISVSIVDGVYTYTFTGNILGPVIVQASNIVIDGDGYTVNAGWLYGFYIYQEAGVTVRNTRVIEGAMGIYLLKSNRNTLDDNTVSGWADVIRLRDGSSRNIVKGNKVSGGYWGLRFDWSASDNIVTGNTVSGAVNGISVATWSKNNLFYHNNIIDNDVQVVDFVGSQWYHPDLLEGNYWSDYPGVDDGSGTGKHAIAGDGIGDTDIPWYSDYYPLTFRWISDPVEGTQELIGTIESWNLPPGSEKCLTRKLDDAISLLNQGNINGAIRKLGDFIKQVTNDRKDLTEEQRSECILQAQAIIFSIS